MKSKGASHGAERDAFFAQQHLLGRLGLSDFTDAAALRVTIAGAAAPSVD
ncbi:hypothetical protein PO883_08610 [Massilia sp. DJPM01]|nr:hypothetical protein [Massilia sp. DJPM01]MDM5177256.1 hypothetical protein [Massilia sp. DJPM01]